MDHPEKRIEAAPARRGVLASLVMGLGLILGYGMGAFHFFRYLVPLNSTSKRREMFVGTLDSFPLGTSLQVRDPRGQPVAITRTSNDPNNAAAGFKALSSTCPHLGCQVHWQPGTQSFYCPCHNGRFDKDGIATEGPPAREGKNLHTYDIRVDSRSGWVMLMVPTEADSHG